jgi:hypothetical protein
MMCTYVYVLSCTLHYVHFTFHSFNGSVVTVSMKVSNPYFHPCGMVGSIKCPLFCSKYQKDFFCVILHFNDIQASDMSINLNVGT